ncbi:extracellular solute-binding protein [Bradyrhizobium lupini]|uniref:extracellular solute-binding protein n=1 Tax=Rhizobium lupini TaxID=136996 RepID=UPI0034C6946E
MVESKGVSWDVVDSSGRQAIQMCAEGLLETIDWKMLGLDRTKFMTGDQQDCGVPSLASATVIAYDKAKLANGPTTIAGLFDTKKIPGARGRNKTPVGNLEWALIADGVAIEDVYKLLKAPDDVDRAFKKLDKEEGRCLVDVRRAAAAATRRRPGHPPLPSHRPNPGHHSQRHPRPPRPTASSSMATTSVSCAGQQLQMSFTAPVANFKVTQARSEIGPGRSKSRPDNSKCLVGIVPKSVAGASEYAWCRAVLGAT